MICPICQNKETQQILLRKNQLGSIYMNSYNRKNINILHCNYCNFVWNSEAFSNPINFEEWISSAYEAYNLLDNNLHNFPYIDKRAEYAKNILSKHCNINKLSKILEVGSNRGDFLAYLEQEYPQLNCIGIESSKLDTGVLTLFNDVRNINFSASFDLVIFRQVFEHIATPFSFLEHIISFVKQNGYIVIEVPDLENDLCENTEIFTMEHVGFYSEETFNHLAQRLNLTIVTIDRTEQLTVVFQNKRKDSLKNQYSNQNRQNLLNTYNQKVLATQKEWLRLINDGYSICFYGASNVFLAISGLLEELWLKKWESCKKYLVDDFTSKHTKIINGLEVYSLDTLNIDSKCIYIICAMNREYKIKMAESTLKKVAKNNDKVFLMWDEYK